MKSKISLRCDRFSLVMLIMLLLEGHLSHTVLLLTAATIHECGHLLAAYKMKIPISTLHISILGARLELGDPLLSYRREWLLCAAGPLASFLLAGGAMGIHHVFSKAIIWEELSLISLVLGMVNLLPIGWLDGGRMFRAMCLQILPQRAANALLRMISFLLFLVLWTASLYLLLRVGNSLTLFVFSFSLFLRFFLTGSE